jgi:hypothetical protein
MAVDPQMIMAVLNAAEKADIPGLLEDAVKLGQDPRYEGKAIGKIGRGGLHQAEHLLQAVPTVGGLLSMVPKAIGGWQDMKAQKDYDLKEATKVAQRRTTFGQEEEDENEELAKVLMSLGYDY